MTDVQLSEITDQIKWLTSAVVNNTVKQVEVECVRKMGRELSAEEKDLIHRDCIEELIDVRSLLDRCLNHRKKMEGK